VSVRQLLEEAPPNEQTQLSFAASELLADELTSLEELEGKMQALSQKPNCAEGNFKTYPVDMTLNKVRERKCGKKKVPLFLKLLLSFPQNAPSSADELGKNTMSCGG
jgi:hypothetical protein